MGFVEQLDELGRTERTPGEKMREALAMYDEGWQFSARRFGVAIHD